MSAFRLHIVLTFFLLPVGMAGCGIEERVNRIATAKVQELRADLEAKLRGKLQRLDDLESEVEKQRSSIEKQASDLLEKLDDAEQTLNAKKQEYERTARELKDVTTEAVIGRRTLSDKLKESKSVIVNVELVKKDLKGLTDLAQKMRKTLEASAASIEARLSEDLSKAQTQVDHMTDKLEQKLTWFQAFLLVLLVIFGLGVLRALFWPATYIAVRLWGRVKGERSGDRLQGPASQGLDHDDYGAASAGCRVTMETSKEKSIFCYPGLITALEGQVKWSVPLVGNPMQWVKRGAAFLDCFRGGGRIVLLPPGPVQTHEINVKQGKKWEVSPSAFLACEGAPPRFRFNPNLRRIVTRRGFSRFEFSGPGRLWIRGMPGLVSVRLHPGEWMLVPMENVAAYSDDTKLSPSALPFRHAFLGRGVFLARLENISNEDTVVLMQGRQGTLAGAAANGSQQGGVFGYVWDVAQLFTPG